MFRPRIIPVLLLKGKGLVKTLRFNKSRARYIGDPINAVRNFNDFEADELIFLDITATIDARKISLDIIKQIAEEAEMPFAYGGGINTFEVATQLFQHGTEKLVFNTLFHQKPELISQIASVYGSQSIIISLDIQKNLFGRPEAKFFGGLKTSKYKLTELCHKAVDYGAGELIINSIENDGKMTGYDTELVQMVSESVNIPVIACGGAGNMLDMKNIITPGKASAAAAGSLFVFHGERNGVLINYPTRKELNILFSS